MDKIIILFACVSLIVGAVECFAGFKIMKIMMAIWGFFIGAVIGVAVSVLSGSTVLGIILAIVLAVALAVLSFRFYVAGICILTVFLTSVALYIMIENVFVALTLAVGVGILAIYFVKPVVIITTSISGAGIIISSAYIVMLRGSIEINPNPVATVVLWVPIALAGMVVQYITTQKINGDKLGVKSSLETPEMSMTYSERKYPGMQRAYRNFCIECGYELLGATNECPRCGYTYDN